MFRFMINTVGLKTCVRYLGPNTIPDGKLMFHPGILHRHHRQIVIYRQGKLQVTGNTVFAPCPECPCLQQQSAGRLCPPVQH